MAIWDLKVSCLCCFVVLHWTLLTFQSCCCSAVAATNLSKRLSSQGVLFPPGMPVSLALTVIMMVGQLSSAIIATNT